MEALQNAHIAWATKLAESEHFKSGGGLHENGVLIIGKDCVIKDGPYLESKELVGGYYLLQADDLNTRRMPRSPLGRHYGNPPHNGYGRI